MPENTNKVLVISSYCIAKQSKHFLDKYDKFQLDKLIEGTDFLCFL